MKRWGGFSLLALASAGVVGAGQMLAPMPASANVRMIVPEDVYRLCDKRQFTRAELRALQQRPDYDLILRYTADECAGVAAVLSGGATATLPGAPAGEAAGAVAPAVGRQPGLGLAGSDDPICDRDRFTTREIAALRRRADFAQILEYTFGQCPAVASLLTNAPTATLPDTNDGTGGEGGTGGGGTGGGGTGGGGHGGGGTGGGGHGGGGTGGGGHEGGGHEGGGTGGGHEGGGHEGGGTGGGDHDGDHGGHGDGDTGSGHDGNGSDGGEIGEEPDSSIDPEGWRAWRESIGRGPGRNDGPGRVTPAHEE